MNLFPIGPFLSKCTGNSTISRFCYNTLLYRDVTSTLLKQLKSKIKLKIDLKNQIDKKNNITKPSQKFNFFKNAVNDFCVVKTAFKAFGFIRTNYIGTLK